MKPNNAPSTKDKGRLAPPAAAPVFDPAWRPNWRWHARLLIGIYVALIAVYFAISTFLSRVPPPYRLREIPKEITPWMKK